MAPAAEATQKTLCHVLPSRDQNFRLMGYRGANPPREGATNGGFTRGSMHSLIVTGNGAQQFRRGAGDPAPDDAGQLVVAAPQALRLAVRDLRGGSAVAADEKQGCFPDLALVGHHR